MFCLPLQAIDAGRQQYAELLADLGFIPASYAAHASAAGGRGRRGGGYSWAVSNPYGEGECGIGCVGLTYILMQSGTATCAAARLRPTSAS